MNIFLGMPIHDTVQIKLAEAHSCPHRGETICMPVLWQTFLIAIKSQESRGTASGTRTTGVYSTEVHQ